MGLGVGHPSAFGGPLYPHYYSLLLHRPIMNCYLLPLASALLYTHPPPWVHSLVFFMSFSHCAFFYCSLFFSLDFPSLIFVFGAAHLSFLVSCGGVVSWLLGLFLALLLFPPSIPFLGLLLVYAGFFVCNILCPLLSWGQFLLCFILFCFVAPAFSWLRILFVSPWRFSSTTVL